MRHHRSSAPPGMLPKKDVSHLSSTSPWVVSARIFLMKAPIGLIYTILLIEIINLYPVITTYTFEIKN